MAGFYKIYLLGGDGGYLGSDGINPITLQILVGTSSREWLEPCYFDKSFKSMCGIKSLVPTQQTDDDNIIDAIMIFAPKLFENDCPLIKDAIEHFNMLGKKRIDLEQDKPHFWDDLRKQAKPMFDKLNLFSANIVNLRYPTL